MIRTLTGANTFLLQTELKKLVSEFVKTNSDMGLERLDGEEVEYDRIRESLESLPFLASRKLVVLRSPSANKQFVENAEKLLTNLSESTDVIIVEPKLDKRSNYYKFLQKNTDYTEFNELDEFGLSKWLVEQAKANDGSISQTDAKYLINRIGLNQQLLYQELKKLLDYNTNINQSTIDLLTEPTPQSTIFELLNAAFTGQKPRLLRLYEEQKSLKVEPQAIIALLAWQLHVLALVKTAGDRSDGEIASEAKINPYVVRNSRVLASNVTLKDIKKSINDLVKLDQSIKTSAIDADDALQTYLLKLK